MPTHLLCQMFVNPPEVEFQAAISKFWDREIKFRLCLFTFSIKREIRHFHVVVVQKRQRNVRNKKVWCTCKVVVLLIKPIVCYSPYWIRLNTFIRRLVYHWTTLHYVENCCLFFLLAVPSSFRTDQYSVLTGSKDCSMKIWSLANGKTKI